MVSIYEISLRIQSECGKMGENVDENNSEYGHFLRSNSYVMCEICALVQKIEQNPERFNTTLNNLKQNDNRNTDMLRKKSVFHSKNYQRRTSKIDNGYSNMILKIISKQNQFKRPDTNLTNVYSITIKIISKKFTIFCSMNNKIYKINILI